MRLRRVLILIIANTIMVYILLLTISPFYSRSLLFPIFFLMNIITLVALFTVSRKYLPIFYFLIPSILLIIQFPGLVIIFLSIYLIVIHRKDLILFLRILRRTVKHE